MKIRQSNANQKKAESRTPWGRQSAGFSLFELVVFIISVAIIYATAVNRFSEFPEAAERANFMAVAAQIQAGVSLESTLGIASGSSHNMSRYDGANPMDMLLSPPSNYLGVIYSEDKSSLPRRSWYFDPSNQELVYLVNNSERVYFLVDDERVPTSEVRFRIAAHYRYVHRQTGVELSDIDDSIEEDERDADYRRRFSGVLMQPVTPYLWAGSEVDMQEVANADQPG